MPPCVRADADLADAAPGSSEFDAMTALYWHFGDGAPKGVNFAKISKVLHLKNPSLFPFSIPTSSRPMQPPPELFNRTYLNWAGVVGPG
jgi:hypothetical protein